MAESAVSFLLTELSALLKEKRQLLGGLGREIESIRDELGQMKGCLRDADAKQETDSNLRLWITQLREISFDVEDVLDKYMLHAGRCRTVGMMKRLCVYLKDLRARDQIAHEIQDIRYRLENVTKSHKKYREMYGLVTVADQGSSSGTAENEWYDDGRGEALFLEDDDVIGIEEPMLQLMTWIEEGGGLDVIAVVGMGGLGKTTLVKKVFDDESVKRRFHRHVWLVASDYKDVRSLLQSLIKKLVAERKESQPQGVESMDVNELRNLVHEILKETSYIVVVDDIWDVSRWDAIRIAFPRRGSSNSNNKHGCIIITTRFRIIADAACSESDHVYSLKPLSQRNRRPCSRKEHFLEIHALLI